MIFEFKDLRGIIKVGMKVRAVEGKIYGCSQLDNNDIKPITGVADNEFHINGCPHDYTHDKWLDVIDFQKTFETLQEGDMLRYITGDVRTVLGRVGSVIFLSNVNDPINCSICYFTWQELERSGVYTIIQDTETPEDTIELLGSTYKKKDIEDALKGIKSV